MTTVTITLDDKTAQAVLKRAGGVPGEKAMRAASLEMKQGAYNAFRFASSPDGTPWPALKAATLNARARRGNHSIQPLIDTGAMYGGIEAANTATDASVTIGDGLPDARAWYNQFGTLAAGGRVPARAMLPMTQSAANPTQAWLETVLKPIRDSITETTEA